MPLRISLGFPQLVPNPLSLTPTLRQVLSARYKPPPADLTCGPDNGLCVYVRLLTVFLGGDAHEVTSLACRHLGGHGGHRAMSLLVGVGTAAAHPDDPHESDEQHAAQDLAGVPIEQIEKDTRANALKIKKATGAAPGGRTAEQRVANERASSAAADRPGPGRSVERGAEHPGGAGLPGRPAQRQGPDVGLRR